jgi:hypothetical protein
MDTPRIVRVFGLACVTALSGFACGGTTDGGSPAPQTGDVAAASATSRPIGAACAFASQCASEGCSADLVGAGCGVCVDVRPLGATCSDRLQACSSSAVCADGVCRTIKNDVGQPCRLGGKGDSYECDDDLYCDGPRGGTGVCRVRPAVGAPCADELPSTCTRRAVCERGTCVARVPSADRPSCGPPDDPDLRCPAPLAEGASCSAGGACAEGLECRGGRCVGACR